MSFTRIQKGILQAMHQINRPATVNEIADWSEYSWMTVRKHILILEKRGVLEHKTKNERKYWRIRYEIFERGK